jgi:hypothetical protein
MLTAHGFNETEQLLHRARASDTEEMAREWRKNVDALQFLLTLLGWNFLGSG